LSAVSEWSSTTQAAKFVLYTEEGYIESWSQDVRSDSTNILFAALVAFLYFVCTLGTFSPIFCRGLLAFNGALNLVLSIFAGFGMLFYFGQSISSFHGSLPFLIMAIGVENMYVICDAIDQVALEKTPYQRVHEALSHAGPAITITSLTTIAAFALGTISSIEALRSFCMFSAVCVAILYLSTMTLFLAAVVWDTQRVSNYRKDCLGFCCCSEDSYFFCKGKLVS